MKEFKYYFGGLNSEPIKLVLSDDMIVIRASSKSIKNYTNKKKPPIGLSRFNEVFSLPDAGVVIFRVDRKQTKDVVNTRDITRNSLKKSDDVIFSGRVLKSPESDEPIIYTENIFIKFSDDLSTHECNNLINEFNLKIKKAFAFAKNAFFVSADGLGLETFSIAENLLDHNIVEFCHPELISERKYRNTYPEQWHLGETYINGTFIDAHANISKSWKYSTGENITIAVIDDGVDVDHEEFNQLNKIVAPLDASIGVYDGRPKGYNDNHGTACAGVACASGHFKASGVAPDAYLMPIRLASNLGSFEEADAIYHAVDNGADVISCSWGPPDGKWWNPDDPTHYQQFPLPDSTRLALEYAITNGRNGLGCVIVWAAGNGNESVSNDGYASYPGVLAIAACNDRNYRSIYSDYGEEIFCCFPSNDIGDLETNHQDPLTTGIWTTDRSSYLGYNQGTENDSGNYTSTFGGTSSAAPGVAGIAALLLSIKPELTWQEVSDEIRNSCEQIDYDNDEYNQNGHSHYYGYGKPNALNLFK